MNVISKLVNSFKKKSATQWFEMGTFGSGKKRTTEQLYYGTVFACIDVIAQGVAAIEPELYSDLDNDGSPDQIVDHPILTPFKRANSFQSGADILYLLSAYIDIYGRSYLYPIPNLRGEPIELLALDPGKVRIVKKWGYLSEPVRGYVYEADGIKIPFEIDELIPIVRPNPFNQVEGISTIQMSRLEQEIDLDSLEYNKGFFERGARPSGVLFTESEEPLAESVFERLKKQWNDVYGGKANAHKTVILEQGLKYQQTSLNQKDMDFIQQRKFSRDEILAIFRVPKTVLAISDDVNRANAESGEYVFAKYTLLPRLQMIYDKLNAFYVPKFGNTRNIWLDFENPVPDDLKTLSDIRASETNTIRTINESRAEIGLPPVSGGDDLYVPLNLLPLTSATPPDSTSTPDESDQDEQVVADEMDSEQRMIKNLTKLVEVKQNKRGYHQARQRYFKQIESKFSAANRQLYADIITEIKKTPIKKDVNDTPETWFEKIMPKLNTWHLLATGVFSRYLTQIFEQSVNHQQEYFKVGVDFDMVNTGATAWLKGRAEDVADSVRDSMLDKARLVIAREMDEENFSLAKVKAEIMQVMKDESEYRAERIARTETANAYEEAATRSYQLSNVQKVEWLTTNPCEICDQNDGVVRPIGQEFPSGHHHAPVHPNCRCSVTPYFGDRIE